MKNPEALFGFALMILSGALVWTAVTFNGWLLLGYCLGIIQALGAAIILNANGGRS